MSEMQKRIDKTREYLSYIEDHYNNVQKAWKELQEKCKDMRFIWDDFVFMTISSSIKNHDISKLSKEEFIPYREEFFSTDKEKKTMAKLIKDEFGQAWQHHQDLNDHHWQNWTISKNNYHPYFWEVCCVHMVADWMAMGYKFNDTAQSYYEKNKGEIVIPDYAEKFIYEIFTHIKESEK